MLRTPRGQKRTETPRATLAEVSRRQSPPGPRVRHRERPPRPEARVERAVALGWPAPRGQMIDEDLAQRGAQAEPRFGFPPRFAARSLGRVGLVRSWEAARLARNRTDWSRLRAVGSICGARMAEAELIDDPGQSHDRWLRGLAGMMRAAARHPLHLRLQEGQRPKAERGA